MKRQAIVLVLLVSAMFPGCGKATPPSSTESQIAGALSAVPELPAFLKTSCDRLAKALADKGAQKLVTESPGQLVAALAGGKSPSEFIGRPVAWSGTIYEPMPNGTSVYAIEGEKTTLVRLQWGAVGSELAGKLKAAGWIVFGGRITQADDQSITIDEAFVVAEAIQGKTLETRDFFDEAAPAIEAAAK